MTGFPTAGACLPVMYGKNLIFKTGDPDGATLQKSSVKTGPTGICKTAADTTQDHHHAYLSLSAADHEIEAPARRCGCGLRSLFEKRRDGAIVSKVAITPPDLTFKTGGRGDSLCRF